MSVRVVCAADVAPQPWRNGAGQTRELLRWPPSAGGSAVGSTPVLRISVADIDGDAPFSVFEGVTRWFAVIEGAGVLLRFGAEQRRLARFDPPLCFDGADPPECLLLGGPTRDLNLMLHRATGTMVPVQGSTPWQPRFAQCGLFTASAGQWSCGQERVDLAPMSLLWDDALSVTRAWQFVSAQPPDQSLAWWLGASPEPIDP